MFFFLSGLSKLREMYPNVTNLTFGRVETVGDKTAFVYDHKVSANASSSSPTPKVEKQKARCRVLDTTRFFSS